MSDVIDREPLAALAERLGHRFSDPGLLRRAVSHRSWCAELDDTVPSNERLEYLGDAVLGLVVAEHVYRGFPELHEGALTDARKAVVNAGTLAEVAAEVDLGPALLLGRGEDLAGGRTKPSILADALEAVVGAVYLDGGYGAAVALIERLLGERIRTAATGDGPADAKTALQELAAQDGRAVVYDVDQEGPDHARRFFAAALVAGTVYGRGEGRSKKQAQQAAARIALARLRAELLAGA